MRYLIIVLFLLCSCDNTQEVRRKAYKEGFEAGYDKGRWNEKMRWTNFQNDSIVSSYLRLQIQVLSGEITHKQAWWRAGDLIMKTTDPFLK